jgi:hypothetical protein
MGSVVDIIFTGISKLVQIGLEAAANAAADNEAIKEKLHAVLDELKAQVDALPSALAANDAAADEALKNKFPTG